MSWRDRLQPASLRGVPFHIDAASGQAGRRVAVHEYPQQEVSWAEDLGKKAGSQTLQAFVIGPDYDLARDELFAALDKPGPATLVHPYLGTLKVQVTDYDWTISTRQGGYCKISINYVPAGKREYPAAGAANAKALETAADSAAEATEDSFAETFTCEGKPAFVEEAATSQLTDAIDTIRTINGKIASVLQPISDIAGQIGQLGSEIATLISQPRVLASRIMGVVASVFGAIADITGAFDAYKGLFSGWSNSREVQPTTPNRRTQANNQAAIGQLLRAAATVELARLVATTTAPFETYDQAIEIRDVLLEELDALIESGDDGMYYALVELQTRLIRRIDDAATDLLRADYVTIAAPVPALVLAHQVYGDATRAEELTTRNSLTDPNFVPTGTDIEVLR